MVTTSLILSIASLVVACCSLMVSVSAFRSGGVKVDVQSDIETRGRRELDERDRMWLLIRVHNRRRAKAWIHAAQLVLPRAYDLGLDRLPLERTRIDGQDTELLEFELASVMSRKLHLLRERRSWVFEEWKNRRGRHATVKVLVNGRKWRMAKLSMPETKLLELVFLAANPSEAPILPPEDGERQDFYSPTEKKPVPYVYRATVGKWERLDHK